MGTVNASIIYHCPWLRIDKLSGDESPIMLGVLHPFQILFKKVVYHTLSYQCCYDNDFSKDSSFSPAEPHLEMESVDKVFFSFEYIALGPT